MCLQSLLPLAAWLFPSLNGGPWDPRGPWNPSGRTQRQADKAQQRAIAEDKHEQRVMQLWKQGAIGRGHADAADAAASASSNAAFAAACARLHGALAAAAASLGKLHRAYTAQSAHADVGRMGRLLQALQRPLALSQRWSHGDAGQQPDAVATLNAGAASGAEAAGVDAASASAAAFLASHPMSSLGGVLARLLAAHDALRQLSADMDANASDQDATAQAQLMAVTAAAGDLLLLLEARLRAMLAKAAAAELAALLDGPQLDMLLDAHCVAALAQLYKRPMHDALQPVLRKRIEAALGIALLAAAMSPAKHSDRGAPRWSLLHMLHAVAGDSTLPARDDDAAMGGDLTLLEPDARLDSMDPDWPGALFDNARGIVRMGEKDVQKDKSLCASAASAGWRRQHADMRAAATAAAQAQRQASTLSGCYAVGVRALFDPDARPNLYREAALHERFCAALLDGHAQASERAVQLLLVHTPLAPDVLPIVGQYAHWTDARTMQRENAEMRREAESAQQQTEEADAEASPPAEPSAAASLRHRAGAV